MPEQDTLLYRIERVEQRQDELDRAIIASQQLTNRRLNKRFYNRDQIHARYMSRDEMNQQQARRREWPVIIFGGLVALASVGTFIYTVIH
jgi:hypothetical protein